MVFIELIGRHVSLKLDIGRTSFEKQGYMTEAVNTIKRNAQDSH